MKHGSLLPLAWVALVVVPLAQCSNAAECLASADCPNGLACFFPIGDCSARGQCLSAPSLQCTATLACTCTGATGTVQWCGPSGHASAPVKSLGNCEGGTGHVIDEGGIPEPPNGCPSGLACELCDVSGYTPAVTPATMSQPNACSTEEIQSFVTACFGANATQTTCNAWQMKEADAGACLGCVFTLHTSKAWGPLVCTSTSCLLNRAGCVDLFLGQVSQETSAGGSGSCGDLLGAIYGCQDYACNTCDTTPPGSSDYDTCAQAAAANECKAYVSPVDSATGPCAILTTDASPPGATTCFSEQDTDMPSFMNAFCGTGP